MLDDVALLAARRIDSIRLARERYDRSVREQEMGRLATEAELRALRAQINPHFLFNALNTVGYLIRTAPLRASDTLMKLTSLLRRVLHTGDAITTLGEEVDLIAMYLEIEQARFEDRLRVSIDVPDELRIVRILPLLIQPLVENAIKHGIANSRSGGRLDLAARMTSGGLVITVINSGTPTNDLQIAHGRKRGIGLANLDARLRRYYSDQTRVLLEATATETRATIVLPIAARDAGRFSEARGA
jgi:two-component system LytT family sensor kinase